MYIRFAAEKVTPTTVGVYRTNIAKGLAHRITDASIDPTSGILICRCTQKGTCLFDDPTGPEQRPIHPNSSRFKSNGGNTDIPALFLPKDVDLGLLSSMSVAQISNSSLCRACCRRDGTSQDEGSSLSSIGTSAIPIQLKGTHCASLIVRGADGFC